MRIIIITGQTATGKTKLALNYAKKYNGEIINGDSRQIYKYLDIITGKDLFSSSHLNSQFSINNFNIGYYLFSTKIWLYDIVDPKQYFSSFDWTNCALFLIKKLLEQKITPIIVGGTYLYLHHLLYRTETENIPPNWPLRQKLANNSVLELQKKLLFLDTQSFNRLNRSEKNNPQRLIRKIEILQALKHLPINQNKPQKYILAQKLGLKNINIKFIGIKYQDKKKLKKAITKRVINRLQTGAIEEVKNLLTQGYQKSDPGLKTIGYQQIISYLEGKLSKQQAIDQWITKELQYAKRQYTFMKKDKNIQWKER